mmetsp:Transcript_39270/g.54553  ORF Transcript_39270/g.54553 Transcript_39270/m.54553 type:complete len:716 (-) Transcript_39270:7-2154(-)
MAQSPGPVDIAVAKLKTMKTKKRRNRRKNKTVPAPKVVEHSLSPAGSSGSEASESEDEGVEGYKKGGYHPVYVGEMYKKGRYEVTKKLGWGHFSTVWSAWDSEKDREVALKVQKSATHYTEAAYDEITLLRQIAEGDPNSESCCCRLLDSFEHAGPHGVHVCMVFHVLGDNLLTLIKRYNYRGVPLPMVKRVVGQILVGLDYIHENLQIIHTDLKLENVLLSRQLPGPPKKFGQKEDSFATAEAEAEAEVQAELEVEVQAVKKAETNATAGQGEIERRERAAVLSSPPTPPTSHNTLNAAEPSVSFNSSLTSGELATEDSANGVVSSGLTKNQKKKLKRKQKKAEERACEEGEDPQEEHAAWGRNSKAHDDHGAASVPPPHSTNVCSNINPSMNKDAISLSDADMCCTPPPPPSTPPLLSAQEASRPKVTQCNSSSPTDREDTAARQNLHLHPHETQQNEEEDIEEDEVEGGGEEDEEEWSMPPLEELLDMDSVIVDFGNACWTYKQFTSDIQTRQYRCPEVIVGSKYSTPADIWSLACITFELATGDLLFDPRSGEEYDRDEDHLALFMELLGRIPKKVALGGKYSRDFFNRQGELRHIRKLRFWPIERVLMEKYDFDKSDAVELAAFLTPMLDYHPDRRATAGQMLQHPWLQGVLPDSDEANLKRDRSPSALRVGSDHEDWSGSAIFVSKPDEINHVQSPCSESEMSGEWELV